MGNAYDNASLIVTPNGYKASKIYALKPTNGSGDLSFSRASTALRLNSAGLFESVALNVPRLQYPVGGGCPSWLFEPQATNLILKFDPTSAEGTSLGVTYAPYSWNNGLLVNAVSYPSGVDALHYGATSGTGQKVISVFIIMDDLGVPNGGISNSNDFQFVLGNVPIAAPYTIEYQGNNIYRVSVSTNVLISSNNNGVYKAITQSSRTFKLSGLQIETGSTATSPIITAGSTVTRLVDSLSTIIMGNFGVNMAVGYTYLFKLKNCLNPTNQGQNFGTNAHGFSVTPDLVFGTGVPSISVTSDTRTIVIRKQAGFIQMWVNGNTNTPATDTETDSTLYAIYTSTVGKSLDLLMIYSVPLSDSECLTLSNL